jgi:rhodanese-related sulfurtransferase
MKKFVGALVAAIAGVALLSGCSSSSSAVHKVDPVEFSQVVAESGTVVIDVRTPAEFSAGHIPNAVNINVEGSTFADDISKLDKNTTYAVYCRSGNRSGVATAQMADAGFVHIYDLQGGINDWAAAGGEVVN